MLCALLSGLSVSRTTLWIDKEAFTISYVKYQG